MAAPSLGQLRRHKPCPLPPACWAAIFVATATFSGHAAQAADEEPPKDVQQDVETFEAAYSLGDEELLARIAPPFVPERMVYYRTKHAFQAQAIPRGPDTMVFRWQNNKLKYWLMNFSGGKGTAVRTLLMTLADVYPQEIEGDQQILDTKVPGDFVLRVGQPREQAVAVLEAILRDDVRLPVRLRFRDVKRPVYVLRGEFEFTPLKDYPDSVQIYGDELVADRGAGEGGGDFSEFVKGVGMWIEQPVVSEVENPPRTLSWRYHLSSPFTPQQSAVAKNPRSVLKNLEGQTGLTFAHEVRETRMLFVEREQ